MSKFDKLRRSISKRVRFFLLISINITVLVFSSALAYSGIDQAVSDHASTGELIVTIVLMNIVLIAIIVWLIKSIINHNEEMDSLVDKETGLYTRKVYNDMVKTEISRSRRYQNRFSLVVFEINDFDKIIDKYGYKIGDEVQKLVSDIVKVRIRESDEFFKIDRERFAIVATQTDLDGAKVIADKLYRAIESYKFGLSCSVTANFGVTIWDQNQSEEMLLKAAKLELLKAKSIS